jgi:hypothetical protein
MGSANKPESILTTNVRGQKVVVFRFYGGPRDGQDVRSDDGISPKHRINEAIMYWLVTAHGEVGIRFASLSPRAMGILAAEGYDKARQLYRGALRKYRYEVIDKKESSTELMVVCEFRGEGDGFNWHDEVTQSEKRLPTIDAEKTSSYRTKSDE